jgi:hypothetical protein
MKRTLTEWKKEAYNSKEIEEIKAAIEVTLYQEKIAYINRNQMTYIITEKSNGFYLLGGIKNNKTVPYKEYETLEMAVKKII